MSLLLFFGGTGRESRESNPAQARKELMFDTVKPNSR